MKILFKNTLLINLVIRVLQRIVIPGINGFILAGILAAGLWPFRFLPKNHCRIDEQSGALDFYRAGLAYLKSEYITNIISGQYFTIRMEIEPKSVSRHMAGIFTLYTPAGEYLSIRQWESLLLFRSGEKEIAFKLNLEEEPERVMFTMVVTPEKISVQGNGTTRVMERPAVRFVKKPVTVVLGNSGAVNRPWYGKLHFLSIDPVISATSAQENRYTPESISPDFNRSQDSLSQQSGSIWPVSDTYHSAHIHIPRFLLPLRPEILVPPWVDFRAEKRYYLDVVVNYLGFIPAGFFLCALLCVYSGNRRRNVLVTFVVTLLVSLFIELAQVLLPTRSSQLSDVLLNSTGGMTGAVIYVKVIAFVKFVCGRVFKSPD